MPRMYDDLWTAAKGMYKMDPVVVDGGEVVIYAPHITEVSYSHGKDLDEIGYHCRDYFLKQWDKFGKYPAGCSRIPPTLKGWGSYDAKTGVETPRIKVTLAQVSRRNAASGSTWATWNPRRSVEILSGESAVGWTFLVVPGRV